MSAVYVSPIKVPGMPAFACNLCAMGDDEGDGFAQQPEGGAARAVGVIAGWDGVQGDCRPSIPDGALTSSPPSAVVAVIGAIAPV